MEWVKLYTTFHDHRKTVELDANAIAPWTLCLSWSGAQDTDGFIPRRIALRFLADELGDEAAARLVRVGLWEAADGGYRMTNWDERQTTAADRNARRAQWRDRKVRQKAGQGAHASVVHAPAHAGFTRESRVLPATREEERREEQMDSPPAPSRGNGAIGSNPAMVAAPQRPIPDDIARRGGRRRVQARLLRVPRREAARPKPGSRHRSGGAEAPEGGASVHRRGRRGPAMRGAQPRSSPASGLPRRGPVGARPADVTARAVRT